MIFLIALIISVIFWLIIIDIQHMNGMGVGWRVIVLVFLLIEGVAFIIAGIIAPPGPRGVILQIGAAFLATIPVIVGYITHKNKRGWW